jgi:hypothetical protein
MKNSNITIVTFFVLVFFRVGNINAQELKNEAITLTPSQIDGFRKQAIIAVNDLNRHIEVMVNKSNPSEKRITAVDLAAKLFCEKTATGPPKIEVTSITEPGVVRAYEIKNYFNRLRQLPYKSVEITWYDIYLSSDLTKGEDGKYYGVATIYQKFVGKTNSEFGDYVDLTEKSIQIIVEAVEIIDGDKMKEMWILKLGDIKVQETRSN